MTKKDIPILSNNEPSRYRDIGSRLASFVQEQGRNTLTPSKWKGLIADYASEDVDMQIPLQYICQSKQFETLSRKTAIGEASLVRDMILASARLIYTAEIVEVLGEFLDGYLGIEQEQSLPRSSGGTLPLQALHSALSIKVFGASNTKS